MSPEFLTALPFIIIGLVLLLLVIWLVARSNRTTTIVDDDSTQVGRDEPRGDPDKPTRNQALIDAPKSAEIIQGTTSANANADEIAMAGEQADAEAGVSVAPTVGDPVPPRPDEQPEALGQAGSAASPTPARASAPHPEAREGERNRPSPPAAPGPLPASVEGDDLTRIKGLGPKLASLLRDQGVTRFDQIANWSDEDVARVDGTLGKFKGRITRDQWVEQARLLREGDQTAFDAKFGRTS